MTSDKRVNVLLHTLRSPFGRTDDEIRAARLKVCDLIEALVGNIPAYEPEPFASETEDDYKVEERNDIAEGFDRLIDSVMDEK